MKQLGCSTVVFPVDYLAGDKCIMYYAFFDTFDSIKTELNIKVEEDNRSVIADIQKQLENK